MLPSVLMLLDAGMLVLAAVGLMRLWPVVRQTTLTTVWPWAWVAWAAAVLSWSLRFGSETLVTYADYFTAVAVLSPPLASLGARRPTCRSWPYFVLLPMFAVLLWPAISIALATRFSRPLVLDTPAIVMYVVVLIMSWGNYALGRLGVLITLFGWLLAGIVYRESAWTLHIPTELVRSIALLTAMLLIFGFRNSSRASLAPIPDESVVPKPRLDRFDRTLIEFGELFGFVWGLRIQDRLNVFAKQQGWPGEFAAMRGIWREPLTADQETQVEHAFRWLFRRFVDSTWIDTRLHTPGTAVAESYRSSIDS